MKMMDKRVNEDIEALKNDLRRLGADLAAAPDRIRSLGRNRAMRSRERLWDALTGLENRAVDRVRDTSGMVKDRVRDTSDALKDRGHETVDKWRGGIGHRPLASLAVAFVAGWLLGSVAGYKCRSH